MSSPLCLPSTRLLSTLFFLLVNAPPATDIYTFPYTTLFRSFEREQGLLDKDFQLFYSQGDKDVGLTSLAQDRKSTRLNSSHRCISYAVFCLKKKKEEHEELLAEM